MSEFTYIDTRLLWLLMLLATGSVQYLLVGAVKLAMRWTRERDLDRMQAHADEANANAKILTIAEYRKEQSK